MKIEIVAEIAQGFEGSVDQARLLVIAAAKAGANAAKFQLVYADELSTPDYTYYNLFSKLEMTDDDWISIKKICDSNGVELILDVFGELGLRLVEKLDIRSIKLHATDINNLGFLDLLSKSSIDRIMVGVGGAYQDEIIRALEILRNKNVVLLHGFQGYPTAICDNQMSRLKVFDEIVSTRQNVVLGFSDHVSPTDPSSISLPAFALGLGAIVLEKHLTLASCMELEDHEAAMNPDQFHIFTKSIRDIEKAQGESKLVTDFEMSAKEQLYRKNIRRHVVANKTLKAGAKIKASDVTLKRTASKTAYTDIQSVYNKELNREIIKDSPINEGDVN